MQHFDPTAERMRKLVKNKQQAGFSILELLVVVTMSVIIATIAVPTYLSVAANLRASGDLRSINGLTALAKMRAASDFTHARVYADLTANTYHMEVWNKAGNGGAGCWQTDGDTANACTVTASPVFKLAQGDTFGAGGQTQGPTVAQQPIPTQAACQSTLGGNGTISSTECIVFNSRGIPITGGVAPTPTPIGAIYLTNGTVVGAVTVSATGSIQSFSASVHGSTWYGQ
jgi:prepilin-type N-terminal cleavage/methylation domain-containing protein